MSYAIDVEALTVAYENRIVLEEVSWRVKSASLAAVIGPNGGGKSTLLKSLVGLLPMVSGRIRILGQEPKQARRQVAYLPQAEEVDWGFPISCLEVVLQGCLIHKQWWRQPTKHDRQRALECLQMVDMSAYAHQPIGNLSGGQKQRVFIARALAQQAELIIMDEPGTGLDADAQHRLLDLFCHLQKLGHTIVITTHDLNCLAEHFDTVLGLNHKVVLFGPPAQVLDGATLTQLFAKHFPKIGPKGEVSLHDR